MAAWNNKCNFFFTARLLSAYRKRAKTTLLFTYWSNYLALCSSHWWETLTSFNQWYNGIIRKSFCDPQCMKQHRLCAGDQMQEPTAQDAVASLSLVLLCREPEEPPATRSHFQAAPNFEVHFALENSWTWWCLKVPSNVSYSKVILQS